MYALNSYFEFEIQYFLASFICHRKEKKRENWCLKTKKSVNIK